MRSLTLFFLDFAKAFDSVNHRLLLHKLATYGLHSSLLAWIKSFLEDRIFSVSVNGSTSGPKAAVSGVPQGSVLGPILFLLFINDLPRVLMFADDVKLISPRSESVVLQSDIHAIHSWNQEWDPPLNENKCSIISVGQSPTYPYTLYPGGPAIINADTTKDLGVHVDRSFKPSRHCGLAAQRARAALFFDCANIRSLDTEDLHHIILLADAPSPRVRHPNHLSLSKKGRGLCRESSAPSN